VRKRYKEMVWTINTVGREVIAVEEERIMHETEEVDGDDFMVGLGDLCEDDISMPSY